ncbi:MAG: SH3 domain-containing protein [Clostridiaceae bacterium]|nr:SH3 domain-containing protein [Clostridiaceae bacterium]
MRFRVVYKRNKKWSVLAIAVCAVVTLPLFLFPIGLYKGTRADILVGRAYAAHLPQKSEDVLVEDWALTYDEIAAQSDSGLDQVTDPLVEDPSEVNVEAIAPVDDETGLIMLSEGQTVGQTYFEGMGPAVEENNYDGILTATIVQTYDSSNLPVELLDTSVFLSDDTTYYIKAANSIIKETPNMDSKTLTSINIGKEVVRTGIGDSWSRIRTEDGIEGYVLSNTITDEMVFIAIDRTVWVDADGLKLRSEPSTSSEVIKTLSRHTQLRCTGVSDKWYKVTTEDGDQGYVYLSFTTTKAPPTPTPRPTPRTSSSSSGGGKTSSGSGGSTASLPTITGVNGESVINVCISMLGVPYVWAGESRNGVDCSGLVVYAYRQVGVGGLPHQSNSLKNYGVSVSRSDLKLGDVICYDMRGSSDSVEHVGIYAGNGQVIHASSSRNRVEYANLDMYPIVSIRRFIQ